MKIILKKQAQCIHARNFTREEDLGFMEGLGIAFMGGAIKNKTVQYAEYTCTVSEVGLKSFWALEQRLVQNEISSNLLKDNSGWTDQRFVGRTYNRYPKRSFCGGRPPPPLLQMIGAMTLHRGDPPAPLPVALPVVFNKFSTMVVYVACSLSKSTVMELRM